MHYKSSKNILLSLLLFCFLGSCQINSKEARSYAFGYKIGELIAPLNLIPEEKDASHFARGFMEGIEGKDSLIRASVIKARRRILGKKRLKNTLEGSQTAYALGVTVITSFKQSMFVQKEYFDPIWLEKGAEQAIQRRALMIMEEEALDSIYKDGVSEMEGLFKHTIGLEFNYQSEELVTSTLEEKEDWTAKQQLSYACGVELARHTSNLKEKEQDAQAFAAGFMAGLTVDSAQVTEAMWIKNALAKSDYSNSFVKLLLGYKGAAYFIGKSHITRLAQYFDMNSSDFDKAWIVRGFEEAKVGSKTTLMQEATAHEIYVRYLKKCKKEYQDKWRAKGEELPHDPYIGPF